MADEDDSDESGLADEVRQSLTISCIIEEDELSDDEGVRYSEDSPQSIDDDIIDDESIIDDELLWANPGTTAAAIEPAARKAAIKASSFS
jgi:hypothetical protein